jgi:hypothetical protein
LAQKPVVVGFLLDDREKVRTGAELCVTLHPINSALQVLSNIHHFPKFFSIEIPPRCKRGLLGGVTGYDANALGCGARDRPQIGQRVLSLAPPNAGEDLAEVERNSILDLGARQPPL